MSVAVYPRLNVLLRERNWSVAELERQIERRFGRSIDPKTLYRLAASDPVERADLKIAATVASVLGVGLDDLFDVQAIPVECTDAESQLLTPDERARFMELLDLQSSRQLSPAEQQEAEELLAVYGKRLHEYRVREIATMRGISIEQARREIDESFQEAVRWINEFEADPVRQAAVIAEARRQRGLPPE